MNSEKSPVLSFLKRNGAALLIMAGLFYINFIVVFQFRSGGENYDYLNHVVWAIALTPQELAASFYNGSEYLWHGCVKLLFTYIVPNMWAAAAIVTAAADAAAYYLVFKALEKTLPEKFPRWLMALLVGAVFFVNALTLPGGASYSTKGAVNTWHNPTNIMVRPFAAAAFYMTVQLYDRRRNAPAALYPVGGFSFADSFGAELRRPVYSGATAVLYPLCLLFSAYAKPSFLQFFAPAIFLFLLADVIRTKGRLFPFCLKMALAFVPAALIVCSQFFSFFDFSGAPAAADAASSAEAAAGSGIAVYFIRTSFSGVGEFLGALAHELWIPVCLCAFPLFVLAVSPRRFFKNTACGLSSIGLVIGWLESLLLHETGTRASHGNFLWGFYLAVWMFWTAAMGQYITLLPEKSTAGKLVRWVGTPLLLWHLTAGLHYLITILQTGLYYF